jgi:hypothetical protein
MFCYKGEALSNPTSAYRYRTEFDLDENQDMVGIEPGLDLLGVIKLSRACL